MRYIIKLFREDTMTRHTTSPQPQAVERKDENLADNKESNLERREENGLKVRGENIKTNPINHHKEPNTDKRLDEHETKRG
jgi:hypothetical protein